MIKDSTNKVRDFLKSKITTEMSNDENNAYQSILEELDVIDKEDDAHSQELTKCKDTIVTLVNKQGSANPPKDAVGEQAPRTLEEIAVSVVNGGK